LRHPLGVTKALHLWLHYMQSHSKNQQNESFTGLSQWANTPTEPQCRWAWLADGLRMPGFKSRSVCGFLSWLG